MLVRLGLFSLILTGDFSPQLAFSASAYYFPVILSSLPPMDLRESWLYRNLRFLKKVG